MHSHLGVKSVKPSKLRSRLIRRVIWRQTRGDTSPFSIFGNTKLRALIAANVSLERLRDKHLFVAATNFTTSQLKAAFVSPVAGEFCATDFKQDVAKRRLSHIGALETQDSLVDYLLASTAIPIFFPPVKIGGDWFIDGGVGNNTPTREAALFLRHLEESHRGRAGDVYCVLQDPPGNLVEGQQSLGVMDLLLRTIDVYHYVHMTPVVQAWSRINKEVDEHEAKVRGFLEWLSNAGFSGPDSDRIAVEVTGRLGRLGGITRRGNFPFYMIQPSGPLGETLDFSPTQAEANMRRGYVDTLAMLRSAGKLNTIEFEELAKQWSGR
jgi:hypothetical protein